MADFERYAFCDEYNPELCLLEATDKEAAIKEAEAEMHSLCDGQGTKDYSIELNLYGMTADEANQVELTHPRATDQLVKTWSIQIKS